MDLNFFHKILSVDSTSGKEAELADLLADELAGPGRVIQLFEVGDGIRNLLVSWGHPDVIFCTHLDTVPPYIPACSDEVAGKISGRGACDAKGQVFAMYEACKALEAKGYDGFGLLLLAGEETGSYGAKALRNQYPGAEWVVVGEPTDNCMVSASKGTKSFEVRFIGKAFHSGYPEHGLSAVMMFNDFINALRSIVFPKDELLGETTWNVGMLRSDNPQNIISDSLSCRIYFRTTFESDEMVCNVMKNIGGADAKLRFGRPEVQDGSDVVAKDVAEWQRCMEVTPFGGDSPMKYAVLEGFDTKTVSFGSDAPQLTNFRNKILCGPGSILVAHRPEEYILLKDIEAAVQNYIKIFETLRK